MIKIRLAQERGRTQMDWLDSYHTFSFGEYHDSNHMQFGPLRVINEDVVQPNMGFGRHPHQNMEIITYIVQGALSHQDSLGTGTTIRPGEIQRMSAGTGVEHSEFNHSKSDLVHLLQIWIRPEKEGLPPSYEQKSISTTRNQLILIGSREGAGDAVTIHQNVKLFTAHLDPKSTLTYELKNGSQGWLQLIKGKIDLNGQVLSPGDGAAIENENRITIKGLESAELLLFDLGIN